MYRFHKTVERIQRHDDSIRGVATGNHGKIGILNRLIQHPFETISSFSKIYDSHDTPPVLFIVQLCGSTAQKTRAIETIWRFITIPVLQVGCHFCQKENLMALLKATTSL